MSFSLQTSIQNNVINGIVALISPIGQNLTNPSIQNKNPFEGGLAYNSSDNKLYIGDGSHWNLVSGIGSTGIQGNTGSTGLGSTGLGATGIQGFSGSTGSTGLGSTGIQGDNGSTGSTGLGSTGVQGFSGSTGLGSTGSTGLGDTGVQGSTGSTGLGSTGIQGFSGSTGLGSTGIQGNTGSTGLGTTGIQGFSGSTGSTGLGSTGIQGFSGSTGSTGLGSTGIQGFSGSTGLGSTGIQGNTGSTGLGSTGTLPAGLGSYQYLSGNSNIFYNNIYHYIAGSGCQYTTISAAITQAVSDGAGISNPKIIFVTEGVYNENLTMSDGIYVVGQQTIGFNQLTQLTATSTQLAVRLNGNVIVTQTSTSATVNCGIANMQFILDTLGNNTFQFNTQSGGAAALTTIFLNNVFAAFSNSNIFSFSATDTSGTVRVLISASQFAYVANNGQQFFNMGASLTTLHVFNYQADNTFVSSNLGLINTIAFGRFTMTNYYGTFNNFFITHSSAAAFTWVENWSVVNKATANQSILISTSSANATLNFNYCTMRGDSLTPIGQAIYVDYTSNTGTSSSIQITNCIFQNDSPCVYCCPALNNSTQNCKIQNCSFQQSSNVNNPEWQEMAIFNGIRNILYRMTGKVQTSDATPTVMVSQVVPTGVTYVEANIYAINSGLTDAYSSKLICNLIWDGVTATLGTVATVGLNTTSTASATITNSTNTIQVKVTGIAATTYIWACNFMLQIKN